MQPRKAVAIPSIGQVVEIAGSGSRVMMHADRLEHLMDHPDMSIAMSGQVGSQIKMKVGVELARRQRPHPVRGRGRHRHRQRRLPRRRRAAGQWQSRRLPPRRDALPHPGLRDPARHHRGHARHLRRRRQCPHPDRHRLPDRGYPRHALRRPDAVEAFRHPRLDRHRQVDLGRAHPPPHLAALARGPHRDDRSARRIFGGVQELRRIVQRRQSPAALLAAQLHRALRSAADHRGRRARARRRHPRQMPARGAHEGQECRSPRQGHRRFADPLSVVRPQRDPGQRNGQARPRRRHAAVHAPEDQARRTEGRPALQLHVLGDARQRHDGRLHRQAVPPAEQRQADLDRRRLGPALGRHVGRGVGARANGVRLCHLVAHRGAAPDPARLRGSASLRPQGRKRQGPGGAQDPRADRQGRP